MAKFSENIIEVLLPKFRIRVPNEITEANWEIQYEHIEIEAFNYGYQHKFDVIGLYEGKAAMRWVAGVIEKDISG